MRGISSVSSSVFIPSSPTYNPQRHCYLHPKTLTPSRLLKSRGITPIRCSSAPPGSGDSDSKAALDAFFLGKAFAEALNERIESTVGEFLSVVGQWQAETRREVLDFQAEVEERAKRAKEKAAMEAMEAQSRTFRSVPPSVSGSSTQTTYPSNDINGPLQDSLKDS